MANSKGIKVISEWFVRPEQEVEVAKQPYYLGPIDLVHLSMGPIQMGHLFSFEDQQHPTRLTIQSIVERLKRSLSIALFHFYPLAGRLETKKYEDEHACLIYVDCIKGPGARLVHATYLDLTVSDILSSIDVHPAVGSFFDLGERAAVNHDGHTKPLLSIQVTELLDGAFIGFTVNHSILDGTSFIHFVSSLSDIFRSGQISISRTPLCKMYVAEGYGPVLKLPYLEPEEFVSRGPDAAPVPELRRRIFHFSTESVKRLKAKANEESESDEQLIISSFMALSGLVWRSITRASNLSGHEETSCPMMFNARTRLDPPLSDNYFGNYVGVAMMPACSVEELLGNNVGWAARCLVQGMKKNTGEKICEDLRRNCSRPFVFQPNWKSGIQNNVLIGGSARFDMYELEFGMGRAVAVRMGYANQFNGKVNANAGHEGGGSVDLEISLRPQIMNLLQTDEEFMAFVSIL